MKILFKTALTFVVIICCCRNSTAAPESQSAQAAYNKGVDYYNKKEYNKAAESFLKATNTQDRTLEQWSNYNSGNACFQQAEGAGAGNSLKLYENALEFFRRAVDLNPGDKDAKYNFELTQKKLKEAQQKAKQESEKQGKQEQEQNKQSSAKEEKEKQEENKSGAQEKKEQNAPRQQEQPRKQDNGRSEEMSKEEALMLLENFQQEEKEQKEILQEEKQNQESDVEKDW